MQLRKNFDNKNFPIYGMDFGGTFAKQPDFGGPKFDPVYILCATLSIIIFSFSLCSHC